MSTAFASTLAAPAAFALDEVALIPRTALFGNPNKSYGKISPDGKFLSWLAPVNGVMNVWVAPVGKPETAAPVTSDTTRGIRGYGWTYTGQIVYQQDSGGNENFHVYAVDPATKTTRDLTPVEGARATIAGTSRKIRDEILISMNKRDPKFPDLYRVKLATGEMTMVQENPGFADFELDEDFKVRLATKTLPNGGQTLLKPAADGKWNEWISFGPEDSRGSGSSGVNRAGDALFLRDSRGRDTASLKRIDLKTNAEKLLAEHPKADIGGVISDLETHEPLAYTVQVERVEYKALDPKIQGDLDFLAKQKLGDWSLGSRTEDNAYWVVLAASDQVPGAAYLYDRKAKKLTKLYDSRPELAKAPLARMQPVTFKSRDGLDLVSYLSLPKAADAGALKPKAPVPLVLLVHGGPWGRDSFGFSGLHQLLANRGYAVLSVNFRASTGFGKAFVNAGDKQWQRAMQDDLNDAVKWAVDNKIADPAKVAIFGGSYGGYAVLAGLTRDPDLFACGVDIVGPSNLETLLKAIPPYWEAGRAQLYRSVGDPTTEEGRALLKERSPLFQADRIKKPLLIGQGANDPRVARSESEQMVAAMKAKSIPVTYIVYSDEGHGFARPPNMLSFMAASEQFLSKCLGGRAEPIDPASLAGSSIAVPEGVEAVPALDAALKARPAPKQEAPKQ